MSDNPANPRQSRTERLQRDATGRFDVKCLTREGLIGWVRDELGGNEGLALRIYKELWQVGARSFDEMPSVARRWHPILEREAYISFLEPDVVLASDDGTRKFLWKLEDGMRVESVLIPDGDRVTLCMSSQVGCAMACTFCLTGDLGLMRNLKASEIANQPLQVGRQYEAQTGRRITNLVLMGMGEPLHNLPSLVPALETCLDDNGLNYSHRRITVSTVGLVSKMRELADALPVNLAVSLNASTHDQRLQIMPITRRHSMEELLEACRTLPLPPGKRITMEYVMLGGFNDSLEDADRLLELLADLPVKVNLIPYNENPDRDIRRPPAERVLAFQERLAHSGLSCSVRTTKGSDISAACGQLGKARQQAEAQGWLDGARAVAGLSAPSTVLSLRPWRQQDRAEFVRIMSDDRANQYIGGASCEPAVNDALFDRLMSTPTGPEQRIAHLLAVVVGDRIAGHLELKVTEACGDGEWEIVYLLEPSVWGRGLGTELVLRGTALAAEHGRGVVATVEPSNAMSLRVLKKTRFDKTGALPDGTLVLRCEAPGPQVRDLQDGGLLADGGQVVC